MSCYVIIVRRNMRIIYYKNYKYDNRCVANRSRTGNLVKTFYQIQIIIEKNQIQIQRNVGFES